MSQETMNRGDAEGAEGDPVLHYVIDVRMYGGTYIARVQKEDFRASCTSSRDLAADACAKKFCTARRLVRTGLLRAGQSDTWVLTAVPKHEAAS